MKYFRILSVTIALLAAATMNARDWSHEYEVWEAARPLYADRLEQVLQCFEKYAPANVRAEKYAIADINGDSKGALLLSTWDNKHRVWLSLGNGQLNAIPQNAELDSKLKKQDIYLDSLTWEPITDLGRAITPATDITLRHQPLAVTDISLARNSFTVQWQGDKPARLNAYDRMMFKPHVGNVKFTGAHENPDEQVTALNFKLVTPSIIKKMFRGYQDHEMAPFIVPQAFFKTHNLLDFKRWKDPEPKVAITKDAASIISSFYGGRKIIKGQWLASCEVNERTFYAVQFEHRGTDALAALVCLAEGTVVSTLDYHGTYYGEGESVWFVDDDGDFMEHAPEIQCLVATDKGLEVYIRQYGGESVQYAILREIGEWLVEIDHQYFIYTFN